MNIKICRLCGKELPLTTEHFYKAKENKDGFYNSCKKCTIESRRKYQKKYHDEYYKNNRESLLMDAVKYRQNNEKEISERSKEYRKKNRERLIMRSKEYYRKNKEHFAKVGKIRREKDKESIAEYKKEYAKINKDYLAKYHKKYREKNKDILLKNKKEYYEKNKECFLEKIKKYRKNNRDKCNVLKQRYVSRKKKLASTLTSEQWQKIRLYFNNKCCYCGLEKPLTMDHFIPVTKGGEFTENNIVPACQSCNSSKQNKDFLNWYPDNKNYSKEREEKILKFLKIKK